MKEKTGTVTEIESRPELKDTKKTIITLTDHYGRYTISKNKVDIPISEMFDDVIIPLLIASGYAESAIDEYLEAY